MQWSQRDEVRFKKIYGKASSVPERFQFKKHTPDHEDPSDSEFSNNHPFIPKPKQRHKQNQQSN